MKKTSLIFFGIFAFMLCVNSNAWAIEGWADSVISSSQGAATINPSDPTNTLGISDFNNLAIPKNDTYYNLGDADGFLTVGFSNPIILGPGIDVEVYEIGIIESMQLKLPGDFIFSFSAFSTEKPVARGLTQRLSIFGFDLGDSGQVSSLTLFNGIGSDIDAIKGLTVTPEPLAMTLFLIGGAPIAMNLYRKRKQTIKV